MKKLLSFVVIVISFSNLHSFAQDNPLFRHLPPDAATVFQINIPAITSKLSWQDLAGKFSMAPKVKSDHDLMDIMKNPFATGINITKDFFVTESKSSSDSLTYTTIILHLADSAKFVAFMSQHTPGLRFFNYPNKGRAAGKEKYGVAWDKDFAVVTIVNSGTGGRSHHSSPKENSPQSKHPAPNYAMLAAKKSFAALKGFDGSFYTTDPAFKAGFSDDADMHMWAPRGAGISMLAKNIMNKRRGSDPGFSRAMATVYQSKAHTLSALRFETGRITLKSTTAYPPDSLAFYAKFAGRPLNTDLVARLPKGNLLAMVSFHFDPSALGDMLDRTRTRAKIDSMMAKKDLTIDNIIRAFKGDVLIAVLDPADKPVDSSGKKQPSFYFVTTINDMSSFMTLAGKMKLFKDTTAADSSGSAPRQGLIGMFKSEYTLRDNIFVVSGTKLLTDAFFSNTEKRSTDFIPARVKDNPISLFIDLKTMGAFLQEMMNKQETEHPTSDRNKKVLHALDLLESFTLASGAIQDGKLETSFELKMTNSSENSLRSLIKMMQ